jgi:hypothetical protein
MRADAHYLEAVLTLTLVTWSLVVVILAWWALMVAGTTSEREVRRQPAQAFMIVEKSENL